MAACFALVFSAVLAAPGIVVAADAGLRGGVERSQGIFDELLGSSSDNADPIDSYIKAHPSSSSADVWLKDETKPSASKSSSSIEDSFEDIFKPSRPLKPEPMAHVAMPRHAPSDEGGQGMVVDVKLDSELQESLLQSRKHGRSASAPDVDKAVASQRLNDVYIHDQFAAQAEDDVKKQQQVNADHDMKA